MSTVTARFWIGLQSVEKEVRDVDHACRIAKATLIRTTSPKIEVVIGALQIKIFRDGREDIRVLGAP